MTTRTSAASATRVAAQERLTLEANAFSIDASTLELP